jgi:hypothetical protein
MTYIKFERDWITNLWYSPDTHLFLSRSSFIHRYTFSLFFSLSLSGNTLPLRAMSPVSCYCLYLLVTWSWDRVLLLTLAKYSWSVCLHLLSSWDYKHILLYSADVGTTSWFWALTFSLYLVFLGALFHSLDSITIYRMILMSISLLSYWLGFFYVSPKHPYMLSHKELKIRDLITSLIFSTRSRILTYIACLSL